MSHGDGDDLGAQAWPGFVDILSSTMIMFVFFLMITATALFFHTIMFKSKLINSTQEIVSEQVEKRVEQLVHENNELKQKVEELQKPPEQQQAQADASKSAGNSPDKSDVNLLQQATQFSESKLQSVKTDSAAKQMYVFFGSDAISLTEETNKEIAGFVEAYKGKRTKITIMANKSKAEDIALTARKVSVARMLNVRNQFIQAKFDPQNVTAKIVENDAVDGKTDWVKILIETE